MRRTTSGLIFHDDFHRADGAPGDPWVKDAEHNGTWEIFNNRLRCKVVAIHETQVGDHKPYILRCNQATATVGRCVQARMLFRDASFLTNNVARLNSDWATGGAISGWQAKTSVSTAQEWVVRTASVTNGPTHAIGKNYVSGEEELWKLDIGSGFMSNYRHGSALEVFWNAPGGPGVNYVGQGALTAELSNAAATNHYLYFLEFWEMTGNGITVTNLPAGHKGKVIQSGGLNPCSFTAVEVGGTALIDPLYMQFPATKVQHLDAANVVIDEITPPDGPWGGDVYDASRTEVEPGTGALVLAGTAPGLQQSYVPGVGALLLAGAPPILEWRDMRGGLITVQGGLTGITQAQG